MTSSTSSNSHGPTQDALDPLPVLTCVNVVCREYAPITALEHVLLRIDAFVCPRLLPLKSLDDAVEADNVHLLRRLLAEELAGIQRLMRRRKHRQQKKQLFIVGLHITNAARRALQLRSPHMRRFLECLAYVEPHALGTNDVIAEAAATGDLELLEWLQATCPPLDAAWIDSSAAAGRAAGNGSIHVLEWLVANRWSPSSLVPVDEAVANSQVAVLRWLEQHPPLSVTFGPGAIRQAAALGDLVMLAWLFARLQDASPTDAGDGAAKGGHVHVLEWLLANYPSEAQCSEDGYANAAYNGHLGVLQWLYAHFTKQFWTASMQCAASGGHLAIVGFLLEWRDANDDFGVSGSVAAADGHVDVVKRLLRFCRASDMIEGAAASGKLEMVKWLHELHHIHYAFAKELLYATALGHLDLLEYFASFQRGSDMVWLIEIAAKANRMEAAKWIHAKVSEPNSRFGTVAQGFDRWSVSVDGVFALPIDAAAQKGNVAMVQWLEAHGYGECSTRAMDWAAQEGHLDFIKYLHANRTEGCTTDAMDHAAANGHLHVVKWLHENRTEGCTTAAVDDAVCRGHTRVVAFLLEHRTEGCTAAAAHFAIVLLRDAELIHLLFKHRRELIDIERVRAHADGNEGIHHWLRLVARARKHRNSDGSVV